MSAINERFKRDIIIWCFASLTSFLIIAIFFTLFRRELDAARVLSLKSVDMVEKANQILERSAANIQELRVATNSISGAIGGRLKTEINLSKDLINQSKEIRDDLMFRMNQLHERMNAMENQLVLVYKKVKCSSSADE